jgi:hydrogenase expression/formation protein HypC
VSAERQRQLVLNQHELLAPARCLTCSDEAVAARVRSVEGLEAVIAVGAGVERVAIDLVPDARPGDVLLCHAGIALERLDEAAS